MHDLLLIIYLMTSAVHGPHGNGTDKISSRFVVRDDDNGVAYKNIKKCMCKIKNILLKYNSYKVNNNLILFLYRSEYCLQKQSTSITNLIVHIYKVFCNPSR